MSNISPGLNDRFAGIEINKSGPLLTKPARSPRKAYPLSLYPQSYHGTTPSRAPVLSTARRAEHRTLLSSKNQSTPLVAQKRHLHRTGLEPIGAVSVTDSPSRSEHGRHNKLIDLSNCSFMQQTSSSRKKQSGSESIALQTRAVSHSEIYNKRPGHHTFSSKKRQVSKGSHTADITHKPLESSFKASFGDKPTMFSNASPSRHVSTAYTSKAKEDECMRSLNSSMKLKVKVDRTRTPARPRTIGTSSIPKSASSYSLSSIAQGSLTYRPLSIREIYTIIFEKQPQLFEESNSLEMGLIPNASMTPQDLINERGNYLTNYERGEIIRKLHLYYAPVQSGVRDANINIRSYKNNYGFDDSEGNYMIRLNDQIEFRYEILRVLGTGSFGNVVLCTDHKYSNRTQKRQVAIKIIKNELDWSLQAVSEIKMLKYLSLRGSVNKYLLNYCDHFHFRGHMCIVTEVLSINLYTFLELLNFLGVSLKLLKSFAKKILKGLQYIHEMKVIHCDMKPENIMIRLPANYNPSLSDDVPDLEVRIIDFGSSCLENETSFSYIQSRFYRAPEVILGAKYSSKIDIWSFGCVIAEMFSGTPLLPGKTELEQIGLILELFGAPPSTYIVAERKRLMSLIKLNGAKTLNDPLVLDPTVFNGRNKMPKDDRKIKKTLLYSLFNIEGKINLQLLNLQLQSSGNKSIPGGAPSPFKRNVKLSSKSLDVALKLHRSDESQHDIAHFSKFLTSIFQWDPRDRFLPKDLLTSPFLS